MSEIRVNTIVAAEGTSAPNLPYGIQVPTGMGITGAGGVNITGVITATTFSGAVAGTTGTFSGAVAGTTGTFSAAVSGTTGTFSGAVNVDATTDSTSATSGALIVDGGLGVAKNVYIGAGLSVAGTLTYEDVTNVDSVGLITAKSGINITAGDYTQTGGGEFKVGTAVTISSTAGVTTFSGDVIFDGATEDRTVTWDKSADALKFADSAELRIGNSDDLKLYHDGSNRIRSNVGALLIEGDGSANIALRPQVGENALIAVPNAEVKLYHNDNHRLSTTYEGVSITGFTSTSAGLGVTGGMWEGAFIKAGKLTDNKTIGISTSNIFVFTTQETTTGTPNIVWNDTYALSSKMKVGDAVTVTVITTAAAAGYAANWTVDGNAVSEQWNGGSAPSAGGSDGYDVYTLTLVRNGTGTGDSGWIVFANVSNFT